jgi:hypothetical protein
MAKATNVLSTLAPGEHSRRNILIAAGALASAAIAISLAAAATGPAACRDPAFRAIEAHQEATAFFEAENAKHDNWHPAQAALNAEWAAAGALVATAPTTPEGLQALECWLRDDRSRLARYQIGHTVTVDDMTFACIGESAVDWLVAKRRAELEAA